MPKLEPPDNNRCQAEKPNGHNFMTLGGEVKMIRCKSKPSVIATEKKAGKDGKKGSMSLCSSCWKAMIKQIGADSTTVKPI